MTHPQSPTAVAEPPAPRKSRVKGCLVPIGCVVLGLIIGASAGGGSTKNGGSADPAPKATVTVTAIPSAPAARPRRA